MGVLLSDSLDVVLLIQFCLRCTVAGCDGFIFFFFLMIRPPPRSTLFPTRRSSDLGPGAEHCDPWRRGPSHVPDRSEEHTSELQSRVDLVCRLLLEKKKKNSTTMTVTLKPVTRIGQQDVGDAATVVMHKAS